jgi:triosephosphate isomerase
VSVRPVDIGVSHKLYLDLPSTLSWCRAVAALAQRSPAVAEGRVRLWVLPSLPAAAGALAIFRGSPVRVGAQNLSQHDRGAYTGEVSGTDLAALGLRHVEVGHAERRRLFGESEEVVRQKTAAALRNGLVPVLCVGEADPMAIPDAADECIRQLESALGDQQPRVLVVAYEPHWAIGAPEPASAEHIAGICTALRRHLAERVERMRSTGPLHGLASDPAGDGAVGLAADAPDLAVIYGGSAGPGLLTTLGHDVDGLFLGRFAHDPVALAQILAEADVLTAPGQALA